MGRAPCCDKQGLKKGPWTPEEDKILVDYVQANGHGSWRSLPKLAGLLRCGKSCRLRWTNYLRPDIKRGPFTPDEQKSIVQLHGIVGNKWSTIAAQLPGRTDNEIKNYWNTHLKKKLLRMGINPETFAQATPSSLGVSSTTRHMAQWESARLEAEARLSRESLIIFSTSTSSSTSPSSAAAAATAEEGSGPERNGADGDVDDRRAAADFYLRMWNSEVGDAFRKAAAESKSCGGCVSVSSCSNGDVVVDQEEGGSSDDQSYQVYLDFSGEDLYRGHYGVNYTNTCELFTSTDLNDVYLAHLDTAFK